MDREVLVYADLSGTPHPVGRLWSRTRKDRESATFEYDKSWLAHPQRFSLEPALKLGPGPFHTPSDRPLFGARGWKPSPASRFSCCAGLTANREHAFRSCRQ
jgi:serine/threonine-protein kinase HipA